MTVETQEVGIEFLDQFLDAARGSTQQSARSSLVGA
jgi:hypothetical protein